MASKKKRMLTIETKQEIIARYEEGIRVNELARIYDRSTSTICTILKQKDAIKSAKLAKGSTVLSTVRTNIHEETEKLLLLWIKEKELAGDILNEAVICEKARSIFADLKLKEPSTSTVENFQASHGWFNRFKKRSGIHSVVRHGEAASADTKGAADFITKFEALIKEEGYIPQQIFNCDETGLFWKKMPRRTYITAEEKMMPGHKPSKDRLTLALCSNASGDCKVKPLLVYNSETPRAFKKHKIVKENLNVLWRSNEKAWVTRTFFTEWINLAFGPAVKSYLTENNLPLKALLLLDNAPAHPPQIEEDIHLQFPFIKVVYLPPNTTSILQPMDQQVIANFKKLYTKHLFKRCFEMTENSNLTLREFWKDHFNVVICLRLINLAWQEVTIRTLKSAWKKLWPNSAETEDDKSGDDPDIEEILSIGKSMGLEVDEHDVNHLVEYHTEERTTEELIELQKMHSVREEVSSDSDSEIEPEKIPTCEIKTVMASWLSVKNFVERNHTEKVETARVAALFEDTCLNVFRSILKKRQRQTSIDTYFKRNSEELARRPRKD